MISENGELLDQARVHVSRGVLPDVGTPFLPGQTDNMPGKPRKAARCSAESTNYHRRHLKGDGTPGDGVGWTDRL